MWHQTLKKINPFVTPQKAAAFWNADKGSLNLVSDGINLVYRFESGGKGFYLRITHPLIRPRLELDAAIDFQGYLFECAVPVCQPIFSKAGHYVEEIHQDDFLFLTRVSAEVPGKIIHFNHTNNQVYKTWGKTLATLHNRALHYQSKQHQFKSWTDLWNETASYLNSEECIIKEEYHAINNWIKTFQQTPDNFGLTHGDHRMGNVLYDGKEVHIIDFDEPIYHWFLADIARPFLELSPLTFSECLQKFEWYLDGYQSIRPLSQTDLKNISWFSRMKALDIYLWSKNNWTDHPGPGGKKRDQWLEELRALIINPIFSNLC